MIELSERRSDSATTEVQSIDPRSDGRWDRYVRAHPDASGYHLSGWMNVVGRSLKLATVSLAALRGEEVVGILPLVRQRLWPLPATLISLPFVNYAGLLSSDDEAEAALLDAAVEQARRLGAARIELRHDRPRAAAWGRREDKVRFRFETGGSEEAMWKALPGQRRTQIRRAHKDGLSEEIGGRELLDDFYRLVSHKWRDLGSPTLPRRFFETVMEQFPDDTRICLVRSGEETAAAGFIYRHGECVENPWVGSLPQFARSRANILLYWMMMQETHRWGAATFDFGRSSRESGNYVFKSRWKAREEALPWSVWPAEAAQGAESGSAAALVKTVWKRIPVPLANRLGPLLSRNLPL